VDHTIAGGSNRSRGLSPPGPLTLTCGCWYRKSWVNSVYTGVFFKKHFSTKLTSKALLEPCSSCSCIFVTLFIYCMHFFNALRTNKLIDWLIDWLNNDFFFWTCSRNCVDMWHMYANGCWLGPKSMFSYDNVYRSYMYINMVVLN